MMDDRLKIIGVGHDCSVLLDDEILLQKYSFRNWQYVHTINGVLIHEQLKPFDERYFKLFIDDICEQIENGVNRNHLTINIPVEIVQVKIGDKII